MKQSDLLFLLFSSFIVVIAWIIFTIVHTNVSSTISQVVTSEIAPIASSFDTTTINTLKKKGQLTPVYTVATPTPTPTPQITPLIPISTQSAQQATKGATQ